MDGGGGNQPTTQTNTASTLPAYAQPYMEDLMGRSQALTSAPVQTYGGERQAGITPMQQQAATTAGNEASGPADFNANIGSYMSPYQQNVIDINKREATRDSDIAGQKQQAGAVGAGAFGGYREGIERSERERNLDTRLNDIQSTGLQKAFDAGTAQYNTGKSQEQAQVTQQNAIGTQQQGNQQNMLNQQYQDFLNQQNMPYKQLGFASDILHGVPGTQSATQVYQAPPSTTSQLAGAGLAAYGLSKKKGGVIKKPRPAGLAELALHKMKG